MVGEGGDGDVMQQQEQQQPKTLQLVSGTGDFNESGLGDFAKQIDLFSHGLSYAVVAIMGPQSSGKSTLMNHLFGTRFTEMDALKGRRQTTQGIWMAKAAVDLQPLTLVMDLEGTDGRERGEDDTAFEKQSALFALAVSDVILVNMWCHDIGREQAANKPLLKTVFQVMMRLFSPRKATLLFVIRDKTKTPLETLEPILREDIQRIWDSLPKPEEHKTTPLSEFFNVEVTWLPNYEEKEEEFIQRVAMMRERFQNSTAPGGIAGNRATVVPATGLPLSLETMWRVIRDNKDLDLPAHKVMVATVRCEQIADEKLHQFESSEDWAAVVAASESGVVVADFGSRVGAHVASLLSKYDEEAGFFEESVRNNKRQNLVTQLKEVVKPAHAATMELIARKNVDAFKKALDESTGGNGTSAAKFAVACRRCTDEALSAFDTAASGAEVAVLGLGLGKSREAFAAEVAKHADEVRQTKLKKIVNDAEEFLEQALAGPVAALLDAGTKETWADIRDVYSREVTSTTDDLRSALAGFEMEEEEADKLVKQLEGKARKVVEEKTKQMAQHVLTYMKERFLSVFSYDSNSMPRRWTAKDDIAAITKTARLASLTLMAAVAAVRLDEEPLGDPVLPLLQPLLQQGGAAEGSGEADAFGSIGGGSSSISSAPDTDMMSASTSLASASAASTIATSASLSRSGSKLGGSSRRGVLLAARQWDEIPAAATLLTPQECVELWRKLILETAVNVEQAQTAQDASRGSSWLPPPWAIVAIIALGFNEFMALLRNPLLLLLLVTLYLFGRAMWKQLEVERHFQHGVVPGLIAVSANVVPAVLRILQQLAEAGQNAVVDAAGAHRQAQQQQQQPEYADRHPQPTTWNYADGGDGANGSSSIASGSVGGGSSLRHRSIGGGAEERE